MSMFISKRRTDLDYEESIIITVETRVHASLALIDVKPRFKESTVFATIFAVHGQSIGSDIYCLLLAHSVIKTVTVLQYYTVHQISYFTMCRQYSNNNTSSIFSLQLLHKSIHAGFHVSTQISSWCSGKAHLRSLFLFSHIASDSFSDDMRCTKSDPSFNKHPVLSLQL